jgi:hypothetical protein
MVGRYPPCFGGRPADQSSLPYPYRRAGRANTQRREVVRAKKPPRHARSPLAAGLLALAAVPAPVPAAETASPAAPVFEKDVLPLFQARCVRCHGGERVSA